MKKSIRQLDIYIDESGNFDNYSKHNLIYSVAFVMVDSSDNNDKPISIFESKLSNIVGGDHFVHTGNLGHRTGILGCSTSEMKMSLGS